jgi:DNA processing protein
MMDVAWVALSLTERIGGKTLHALLTHFDNDPRAVLAADAEMLRGVPGIGAKTAERIQAIQLEAVESSIRAWIATGIQIIPINHPNYPAELKAIGDDAPPTLFVRGVYLEEKRIAIVGTRQPTPEARNRAQNLATALVERGYTIVAGLALGIDTAAHMGALIVPEGQTLAVLGCGVLNIYPPTNHKLAQLIMERGAVLSEFHPSANPSAPNLVARNRVITGLSDAVIIVETEIDGGAMHAARFAQAQGRPVYTFDCPLSGNQSLLHSGAIPLRPDLLELPF